MSNARGDNKIFEEARNGPRHRGEISFFICSLSTEILVTNPLQYQKCGLPLLDEAKIKHNVIDRQ
jgi:hypothetical protein